MKWVQISPGYQKLVPDDDPRPELKRNPKRESLGVGIMLGRGVKSFDYYTPGGKKHTISNAHYKDILSRKMSKDGLVTRDRI
mgnify:FL=1